MTIDTGAEWLAPVHYLPGVVPALADASRDSASPDSFDAAVDGEDRERAGDLAVRALARRGLSRREVERELRSHGLDESAISAEADRLEQLGWVDDLALAQDLVARLQERMGYGRQAIAAELTRRILAPAAIEYALDLIDSSEELARAMDLAERRAERLRGMDLQTARRRLTGYLARRGYGGSTVRSAVDHAIPAD
jgi:regulatory protein